MVCVNCGAIAANLVESTLFGHEKGAFTGAVAQQKGVFEEADGGTVFLDEIGELPLSAQAALLRVLETKRLCRVGSNREIAVDVRILAATHRDLEAMVAEGTFRETSTTG
jgi:two-component system response regulator AtoC